MSASSEEGDDGTDADRATKEDYAMLELSEDASAIDAKKAYRRLALKHHPDKNPGDAGASQRFRRIHEAYQRIRNSLGTPPSSTGESEYSFTADDVDALRKREFGTRSPVSVMFSVGASKRARAEAPKSGVLSIGTEVRIGNLKGNVQLNGETGVIEGFDEDEDRYVVRLANESRKIKRTNLQQFVRNVMVDGRRGDLLDYVEASGKYMVDVDGVGLGSYDRASVRLPVGTRVTFEGKQGTVFRHRDDGYSVSVFGRDVDAAWGEVRA